VFKNGDSEALNAMFARGTFRQHCEIPMTLGCELNEQGYIKVDEFQKTNIKGVYAAGDNTTMYRAVSAAVYAGNKAGALINKELIDEEF
jgi:thioredoxin reductase